MLRSVRERIQALKMRYKLDRKAMVHTVFRTLLHQTDYLAPGTRVLWLGVRRYTAGYYRKLAIKGAEIWSLDIDPQVAPFGVPGRHITGDAQVLAPHFSHASLDLILCNGVLGWGIDTPADQQRCYAAMADVLRPGGLLVLGWDVHTLRDPRVSGDVLARFMPADLPALGSRLVIPGTKHVYDFYTRR